MGWMCDMHGDGLYMWCSWAEEKCVLVLLHLFFIICHVQLGPQFFPLLFMMSGEMNVITT